MIPTPLGAPPGRGDSVIPSEVSLDWFYPILTISCVGIAAIWFWRRRHIARGLTCWNCGADLSKVRLYVDFNRKSRCPKCGNEMEVTDTFKMKP